MIKFVRAIKRLFKLNRDDKVYPIIYDLLLRTKCECIFVIRFEDNIHSNSGVEIFKECHVNPDLKFKYVYSARTTTDIIAVLGSLRDAEEMRIDSVDTTTSMRIKELLKVTECDEAISAYIGEHKRKSYVIITLFKNGIDRFSFSVFMIKFAANRINQILNN